MERKAKAELVLLRSNWFEKTLITDSLNEVFTDQMVLAEKLSEFLDVQNVWQIQSAMDLDECGTSISASNSDLIILIIQTYINQPWIEKILPILKGHPLVAWCYLPWKRIPRALTYEEFLRASGSASMFSLYNQLRIAKIPFLPTFGSLDDPMVMRDMITFARTARAVHATKTAKLGTLASPDTQNSTSALAELGILVEKIAIQEYAQVVHDVSSEEIDAYLLSLASLGPEFMVTEDTIRLSATMAVALRKIACAHSLDMLVVSDHDPEIHAITQICPGLPPSPLGDENVIYQSIVDPGIIFANLIIKQLTGEAGFLMQLWFWDKAKNLFVGGNTGLQNPKYAVPGHTYISGDYECSRDDPDGGAQLEFIARPGRVTLLQLVRLPQGWQAIGTTGMCLERELWVEGVPQAVVRLDTNIDNFLYTMVDVGAMQYWVLGYGSFMPELKAFFEVMDIPFQVIEN